MNSKWRIAVDAFGRPARFILTRSITSDPEFNILFPPGRSARHVQVDKGCVTDAIRDFVEAQGAQTIIPQRRCLPADAPSIGSSASPVIVSNALSAKPNSSAASRPDTTAAPKTLWEVHASRLLASDAEHRFNPHLRFRKV